MKGFLAVAGLVGINKRCLRQFDDAGLETSATCGATCGAVIKIFPISVAGLGALFSFGAQHFER